MNFVSIECLGIGHMTKQLETSKKYWMTKDGTRIQINMMPTSHLLNTIHLIERMRMQQIESIKEQYQQNHGTIEFDNPIDRNEWIEFLEYYTQWPEGYPDLLSEAIKRRLIKRK